MQETSQAVVTDEKAQENIGCASAFDLEILDRMKFQIHEVPTFSTPLQKEKKETSISKQDLENKDRQIHQLKKALQQILEKQDKVKGKKGTVSHSKRKRSEAPERKRSEAPDPKQRATSSNKPFSKKRVRVV